MLNKLTATLIFIAFAPSAMAQNPEPRMISPAQLSIIAKASVARELKTLNSALEQNLIAEGYSERKINYLKKSHFRKISPEFAYHKCIFDADNIQTLLSEELSLATDEMLSNSNNLSTVKDAYGTIIWKLISKLCVKSKLSFEGRLQTLSSNGKPLNIDEETAKKISKIYFYPTINGKPNFKKALINVLYGTIDIAYTIGSIQSLIGIAIGDLIVSIAFLQQSAMNLMFEDLPKLKNKAFDLKLSTAPSTLALDLTKEELECD